MDMTSKFSIEQKDVDGVECLYIKGYLDAHTAPELESKIEAIIKNGGNKILVNFSSLDYISSAGLGVFMAFIEDIRFNGGDIKLTEMQPKVFSVFDLLGFPILFDIELSDDDAIAKFLKQNIDSIADITGQDGK
ncbi:MAG: anti-sigma factor antagonist [Bacteroidota bacterium]|nr:anti-sigma factor antagonist [Bacteroidota bacterium]